MSEEEPTIAAAEKRGAEDDYSEQPATAAKRSKTVKENPQQRTDDGEAFFDLSTKRRCTVRKWKEHVLIDIREVRRCHLKKPRERNRL